MSLIKYVLLVVVTLAMLLLFSGCSSNNCDPYAAYHNGCRPCGTYYNCTGGCGQGTSNSQDRRRSLFY